MSRFIRNPLLPQLPSRRGLPPDPEFHARKAAERQRLADLTRELEPMTDRMQADPIKVAVSPHLFDGFLEKLAAARRMK